MKESELYPNLKSFLERQGYLVKGEIGDCDLMAIRGEEEPVIVELKTNLNLSVILQAIDRLKLVKKVYVGIPHGLAIFKKRRKVNTIINLFKMLGLGLLEINHHQKKGGVRVFVDSPDPHNLDMRPSKPRSNKKKREILLGEFHKLMGDPNQGGINKTKGQVVMTIYRQRAILIAEYLKKKGASKAFEVAKALNDPKARNILYDNHYGWFELVGRGVYQLSPRGVDGIGEWLKSMK